MPDIDFASLERAIDALPARHRGPGGVVGVVVGGEIVVVRAWGFADVDRRLPMTPATPMPICSISKQFTCAALFDVVGDPSALDGRIAEFLPALTVPRPTTTELCNMQSGLRDYWAMTVLEGALAKGAFRREDARPMLARMRTTHFVPGSQYSYSNGNFRMLSDLIEERAGRSLGEVYAERLFVPVGMETARLTADTSDPAGGTVGYEGDTRVGFFSAMNRIYWTGDAGISASLTDMLAWEQFIDRTRDDADGLYRRLSRPQTYRDGRPAGYGFGLVHHRFGELEATGHGGALRGFRIQRLHAPSARLSVVVMLNHESDAYGAAAQAMRAALGHATAVEPAPAAAPADWAGAYVDPESGLLVRVDATEGGLTVAFHSWGAETLALGADGVARSEAMILARRDGVLVLERPLDNFAARLQSLSGAPAPDIAGRYVSEESGAGFEIVETGAGAFYGAFDGLLGQGMMQPIYPVAGDVWVLPCQRSMDAPPPGDWTIRIGHDAGGGVAGLTVGCWLARCVAYRKVG